MTTIRWFEGFTYTTGIANINASLEVSVYTRYIKTIPERIAGFSTYMREYCGNEKTGCDEMRPKVFDLLSATGLSTWQETQPKLAEYCPGARVTRCLFMVAAIHGEIEIHQVMRKNCRLAGGERRHGTDLIVKTDCEDGLSNYIAIQNNKISSSTTYNRYLLPQFAEKNAKGEWIIQEAKVVRKGGRKFSVEAEYIAPEGNWHTPIEISTTTLGRRFVQTVHEGKILFAAEECEVPRGSFFRIPAFDVCVCDMKSVERTYNPREALYIWHVELSCLYELMCRLEYYTSGENAEGYERRAMIITARKKLYVPIQLEGMDWLKIRDKKIYVQHELPQLEIKILQEGAFDTDLDAIKPYEQKKEQVDTKRWWSWSITEIVEEALRSGIRTMLKFVVEVIEPALPLLLIGLLIVIRPELLTKYQIWVAAAVAYWWMTRKGAWGYQYQMTPKPFETTSEMIEFLIGIGLTTALAMARDLGITSTWYYGWMVIVLYKNYGYTKKQIASNIPIIICILASQGYAMAARSMMINLILGMTGALYQPVLALLTEGEKGWIQLGTRFTGDVRHCAGICWEKFLIHRINTRKEKICKDVSRGQGRKLLFYKEENPWILPIFSSMTEQGRDKLMKEGMYVTGREPFELDWLVTWFQSERKKEEADHVKEMILDYERTLEAGERIELYIMRIWKWIKNTCGL